MPKTPIMELVAVMVAILGAIVFAEMIDWPLFDALVGPFYVIGPFAIAGLLGAAVVGIQFLVRAFLGDPDV